MMKFLTRALSALAVIAAVLVLGATAANAHEAGTFNAASDGVSPLSLNWD
ncbi:hypothetical protein [Streptomyces sp. NPDC096152]